MNFYYQIASKADYISDIARDIAGLSAGSSIMDTAKAADILRQLQNIYEADRNAIIQMYGDAPIVGFRPQGKKVYLYIKPEQ